MVRKGFPSPFGLRQNYKLKQDLSLVRCLLSSAILGLTGITEELNSTVWNSRSAFTHVLTALKKKKKKKKSDFLAQTVKTFAFTKCVIWCFIRLIRSNRIRMFSFLNALSQFLFTHPCECSVTIKSMFFLLNCVNLNDFWLYLFLTLLALFL